MTSRPEDASRTGDGPHEPSPAPGLPGHLADQLRRLLDRVTLNGEIPVQPAPGWIPCCICLELITLDEYRSARVWCDPNSITCAAHTRCLIAVGETELGLPPAA